MPQNKYSDSQIERIVILGHTGFIGRYLETFFTNKFSGIDIIGKSFPQLDLTKYDDVLSLKNIFDVDTAVIMCSAIKKEFGDNIGNFFKNIQMIVNLCKLMEKHPVGKFIYFSSAAVYGEEIHNLKISENTKINLTSYYGLAKFTCEILLKKTIETNNRNSLLILRPPVIYGPGDQPCYGPSGFIRSALNGNAITLWGDGTEKREFVFVEDIANLIDKLIFNNYSGTLNVASGRSYSFIEIIDALSTIINFKIEVNTKERTRKKVDHRFNNNKLLGIFPEFTFTSLKYGMQKTIEHIKSQKLERENINE